MRIFNSFYKTKYIVALALLLAFAVFVVPTHVGETFAKPEKPDFPVKSNAFFDYADIISTAFIAPERTEFFGRFEGVKELKQRHSAVRQEKLLQKLFLKNTQTMFMQVSGFRSTRNCAHYWHN